MILIYINQISRVTEREKINHGEGLRQKFTYDLLIEEFHTQTQITIRTMRKFDYLYHTYDSLVKKKRHRYDSLIAMTIVVDGSEIHHKHTVDEVVANGRSTWQI